MNPIDQSSRKISVPALSDLFTQYLQKQAASHEAGFVRCAPEGEVIPFEAVPAQPVDARTAWTDGCAAMSFFEEKSRVETWPSPSDWAEVVAQREPVMAQAFALANYPQAVRDLTPLIHADVFSALRPKSNRSRPLAGLGDWIDPLVRQKTFPQMLFVLGVLRVAEHFDRAEELMQLHRKDVPQEWGRAWANEEAALAWHRGQSAEAIALWESQEPSAPVLFNRGMAALFSDRLDEGRTWLLQAVDQIPEASSWHQLGRLYLALAALRQ
jgi:hypothetical protein